MEFPGVFVFGLGISISISSFKPWPIVKLCNFLKIVLAKAPKIIPRNKEKGHFGPFSGPFPPNQSNFKKKCFKGTLMASSMLFRGNLWKMSQQIGINLFKNAILTYFGLFSSGPPWEPALQKKLFFAGNFKIWPIKKVCTVLRDVSTKTPKIIRRKGGKGHFSFRPNFGPILTIFHFG